MLYSFLYPLHTEIPIFNVFRYITFRAGYAALTALLISPIAIMLPPFWSITNGILAHLSFSVLRLRSAMMIDTIQNLTTTLGSLHPLSSK